jgi:actin related protein 2/3 complex subunit 5
LDSPPYGTKNADTKKLASDAVLRVMSMIKDGDIDNYVDDMSPDQADALLKFVYKGFESGENSAQLLKWHASIVNKHGMGAIVRAMQVKRTV